MKKTNPHKQDYLRNVYKTAAKMVVDTGTDPTVPHMKAVKTQEAEVRDVQSKEIYSFAYRGGKHKVQGVVNYIDEMKKVVRQPNTNYIMVEPGVEKHVEVVDRRVQPLSLAKGNVMMLSNDFNDGEKLVKGEVYIYEMKKVVSQPITNNVMVEYSVAVKHMEAVDMLRPLSLAKENVMKHSNDFNEGEMLVMNYAVKEIEAVKYVEVEDTLLPLNLAKENVMMRSSNNANTGKEEVLAELTEQLEVFPPTKKQMKYKVAEQMGVVKNIVRIEQKDKQVKLGRRSVESCKMQRTRIFQLLSWGCIGWQQVPPIVF